MIYKRSELTNEQLKIWELESQGDYILYIAKNRVDLIKFLEKGFKDIKLDTNGNIYSGENLLTFKYKQLANGKYKLYQLNNNNNNIININEWSD